MATSFILLYGNIRWENPLITVVNRWVRWILFSLLIAYLLPAWEIADRPFHVLAISGFLGWFLVESIISWLSIRMLNQSSLSLFPRFTINQRESQWPNQKQFIDLRAWLRANEFKESQALKTHITGSFSVRSSVYLDSKEETLLQFLFFPQKSGKITVYYILMSSTSSGQRFITDNLEMPYGGYFPDQWSMVRKPLCRSLKRLLRCHRERIEASGESVAPWEGDPVDEINFQQSTLEHFNTQEGFLFPSNLHDTHGKITPEGRYRLWKQYWRLRYLGTA